MRHIRCGRLLAATLLFAAVPLAAQERRAVPETATGRIVGLLVDAETGQPIEGAEVRLADVDLPPRLSDRRGRFVIAGVPMGIFSLEIRHLAYGRGSHLVYVPEGETVEFDGRLEPSAIELDELVVTAEMRVSRLEQVGFTWRERRGWGHFLRRDELEYGIRRALYRVPRIEFRQGRYASERRAMFRTGRGACTPAIFLDGVPQRWAEGDVEMVAAGLDLEAVEVYRGFETPPEFLPATAFRPCGAIVLWRRR